MDLIFAYLLYFLIATIVLIASIWLGLLPSFVAFRRRTHDRWFILALNVFAGATVIGWVVALVWAYRGRVSAQQADGHDPQAGIGLLLNDVRQLPLFPQPRPEPMTSSANGSPTFGQAADAIERLVTLHTQGYITAEEFVKLKAEVIGKV
ncbi:superinfection immunity protein [Lichenibacterium ramalinae]|uniref:Superinfection immunity protein n=1 Tax=Lichenibacterium ramalinae TaxID=2316527 RepID=A0A4V1RI63_9HYPH|nr:superinfection immunity protein [Lichenibacterium ramalinae]RYB02473.1 superinfection immunity protein [Lichenibacterium ramalinae]